MSTDDIQKYVVGEFAAIYQTPVPFFIFFLILSGVIWRALAWRYSGEIAGIKGKNVLLEAQVSDYKEKLSGATPDEALRRLDALEAQLALLSPRRLKDTKMALLVEALSSVSGNVNVLRDMAAQDAILFTQDFEDAFRASGWNVVSAQVMGPGQPAMTGIGLQVMDKLNLNVHEATIKSALERADIRFNVQTVPRIAMFGQPAPDAALLITVRIK